MSRRASTVWIATGSAGGGEWPAEVVEWPEEEVVDEPLGPEDARTYRGVAARLNYVAPDRPDMAYAIEEAARDMSTPKQSSLAKLRKIGRYLIGKPRLVSKFKWQEWPSRVTSFTDSDWAGCVRTAKSTSAGAICIGEHVLKTYSRQQKVIALSSAEAELYAMVAASAETLAMAAYARDIGIELECELYCDSSAALGIAQRAGIGKVRHLRTQGLWVQEVRVAGRIKYLKVLGAKNPADLMTKHMSADLNKQHLETLNQEFVGGRAESAPTLNSVESFVQAWWDDWETDDNDGEADTAIRGSQKVQFSRQVCFRPIPMSGRSRKTPSREELYRRKNGGFLDCVVKAQGSQVGECSCGSSPTSARWGDLDEQRVCLACASRWWSTPNTAPTHSFELGDRGGRLETSSGGDAGIQRQYVDQCTEPGEMRNDDSQSGCSEQLDSFERWPCTESVNRCTLESNRRSLHRQPEGCGGDKPTRHVLARSKTRNRRRSRARINCAHNSVGASPAMRIRRRRSVGCGTQSRSCGAADVHACACHSLQTQQDAHACETHRRKQADSVVINFSLRGSSV